MKHFHHHHHHKHFRLMTAEGATVQHKDQIIGRVPLGHKNVQLLVYSADQKWYLQKDAIVFPDGHFHVETTFGFPDSVHDFFIVGLAGDSKITSSPVNGIPSGSIVSNVVGVKRVA